MTSYGRVEAVYDRSAGTQVATTIVGDGVKTVIVVDSTYDFAESGGSFRHEELGTTYSYVSMDEDASTLTLGAPIVAGVTLADADTLTVLPQGSTRWANVRIDDAPEEEAVEMRVNQAVRSFLPMGTRDGLTDGEVVAFSELDRDEFVVTDVVGDDPSLQGEALSPGTVTQGDVGSDGIVPGAVTGVTTVSGKGFIVLRWSPVVLNALGSTQTDLVHYNVYVSTSASMPLDGTTKLSETFGTMVLARTLANGTPFIYSDPSTGGDQQYFFSVQPQDADGVGTVGIASGDMDKTGSNDIVVGSITAGLLESVLELGTTITTRSPDVNGDLVGPGITLTPDALVAYDASGNPTLEVRPNSTPGAVFRGDAEIDNLTVSTLTTLLTTQLAQGATFKLLAGVTDPTQAPTVTNTYATTTFTNDGLWGKRRGLTWDGTSWWTVRNLGTLAGYVAEKWATAGTLTTTVTVFPGSVDAEGCVWSPNAFHPGLLVLHRSSTQYELITQADLGYGFWSNWPMGTARLQLPSAGGYRSSLGYDTATGDVLLAQCRSTDSKLRVYRRDYLGLANGSGTSGGIWDPGVAVVTSASNHTNDTVGVYYGAFDFAVSRYVVCPTTTDTIILNGTADDSAFKWTLQATSVGLYWDGTNFRGMSNAGKLVTYVGLGAAYTGSTSTRTAYAAYSWTNGATESRISSATSFVQYRRARNTITTSTLPTGVTGTKLYLSTASPSKTVASTTSQGVGAGTPPLLTVTNPTYTPLNNPTVSGFGSGTPAAIQSNDGTSVVFKADGSWTLAGLGSHVVGGTSTTLFDSGWVTWTLGTGDSPFGGTVGYSQWRRVGNVMHLRVNRTTNASLGPVAADGNYGNANLNNAANLFPSAWWPDQQVITSARFDDAPVVVVLTTGGNLTMTGGTPSRTFASGSVIQLSATWIN